MRFEGGRISMDGGRNSACYRAMRLFRLFVIPLLSMTAAAASAAESASPSSNSSPAALASDQSEQTAAPPASENTGSGAASAAPTAEETPPPYPSTIPVKVQESSEPPVSKDADDGVKLEDVVVTASKRSKLLRQLASSVGAVSGQKLEQMDAKEMEDYLKLVPGVALNKQDGDRGAPTIRGISSGTNLVFNQQPTGIYLDDVPLTDPFAPIMTPDVGLFDLERVEVLKGPQGVLFGSNSLGGAIRYVTQKPEMGHLSGKLSATGTSITHGRRAGSFAGEVNAPIFDDDLAVRAVGSYTVVPGYIDELSVDGPLADSNRTSHLHGRVIAKWAPTSFPLTVTGTYLRQIGDQRDCAFADQTQNLERSDTPGPCTDKSRISLANLVVDYGFDWGTLQSSTSQSTRTLTLFEDSNRLFDSSLPMPILQHQNAILLMDSTRGDGKSFSQELRLMSPQSADGPWEWLAGAWYMREPQSYDIIINDTQHPMLPDVYDVMIRSKGEERALFGELTRTLWRRVHVTLGGRYYNTRMHAVSTLSGTLVLATQQAPSVTSDFSVSENGFTPKASVSIDLSRNAMVYVLAAKGFRFGGVQVQPAAVNPMQTTPVPDHYKSDALWNYELGTKTQWFSRRLTFDATLFYEVWSNMQITQIVNGPISSTYIDNVGKATVKGAEIAVALVPFREGPLSGLTLSSSTALLNARTAVDFPSSNGTVPAGTRLPGTPRFQISDVISYDKQIGRVVPGLSLVHAHVGHSYNDLNSTQELGGYDTIDADVHVGMPSMASAPRLSFHVQNATDARGVAGATADPKLKYKDIYFIRPRTFEATLSFQFY